jgi:hypothetical protein
MKTRNFNSRSRRNDNHIVQAFRLACCLMTKKIHAGQGAVVPVHIKT